MVSLFESLLTDIVCAISSLVSVKVTSVHFVDKSVLSEVVIFTPTSLTGIILALLSIIPL
ncbi:hypothetical protein D3C76_1803620 [compost metagenome]